MGIHFSLSPVVDVNNNPKNPIINTRSFGEDPDSVIRYSVEFIRGLHDNGMLATAKTFSRDMETRRPIPIRPWLKSPVILLDCGQSNFPHSSEP